MSSHAAYLTVDAVYLVFEGEAARQTALQLARRYVVDVSRWQEMVSGLPAKVAEVPPHARCMYRWEAGAADS